MTHWSRLGIDLIDVQRICGLMVPQISTVLIVKQEQVKVDLGKANVKTSKYVKLKMSCQRKPFDRQ